MLRRAWSYWGIWATPVTLGFCLLGYALARVVRGRGTGTLWLTDYVFTPSYKFALEVRGHRDSGNWPRARSFALTTSHGEWVPI